MEHEEVIQEVSRRAKGFLIPDGEILGILKKHCDEQEIPDGCIVTNVFYDPARMGWVVRVCNTAFEPLSRFVELPMITVKGNEDEV